MAHETLGGITALTEETVRNLLSEYLDVEFGPAEVERVRQLLERQIQLSRELQALDLGGDDPRMMQFVNDRRVLK